MSKASTRRRSMSDRSSEPVASDPGHEQIELRAYQLWQERGEPMGSPEIDWLRAETELRDRALSGKQAA